MVWGTIRLCDTDDEGSDGVIDAYSVLDTNPLWSCLLAGNIDDVRSRIPLQIVIEMLGKPECLLL